MRKSKLRLIMVLVIMIGLVVLPTVAQAGSADYTYYNMGGLSTSEKTATYFLSKGTVVVMSPNSRTVVKGTAAENLVKSNQVKIVVIAGVGSSSQGTAALAKHVATATGVRVAGIVSGYGDNSIYTEGVQGYFIGRDANTNGTYYTEPASAKLAALYVGGARPQKLIGHSKGNMDVANALFKLNNEGRRSMYQGVKVITFGCGVYVPPGVGSLKQYLGSFDSLGKANTVSYNNLTYLYGRYHTTNPLYYWTYMPIQNYVN